MSRVKGKKAGFIAAAKNVKPKENLDDSCGFQNPFKTPRKLPVKEERSLECDEILDHDELDAVAALAELRNKEESSTSSTEEENPEDEFREHAREAIRQHGVEAVRGWFAIEVLKFKKPRKVIVSDDCC